MSIKLLIAIALATGTAGVSTAALGQPENQVIIEKHAVPLTRYVPYGDLSLATKQGEDVLFHRVFVAVHSVCPDVDDFGFAYDVQGCYNFAWAGARPQMRRVIGMARAGFPMSTITTSIAIVGAR